jgi:hypothetical protein
VWGLRHRVRYHPPSDWSNSVPIIVAITSSLWMPLQHTPVTGIPALFSSPRVWEWNNLFFCCCRASSAQRRFQVIWFIDDVFRSSGSSIYPWLCLRVKTRGAFDPTFEQSIKPSVSQSVSQFIKCESKRLTVVRVSSIIF